MRLVTGGALTMLLAVAPAVAGAAAARNTEAGPRFGPCLHEGHDQFARCGTLRVFENRVAGSGRTIDLYFEILPATGSDREEDPIFHFAGGPGAAATEFIWTPDADYLDAIDSPAVRDKITALWRRRDNVYVDVRGTGRSNGLDCMTGPRQDANWSLADVLDTPPLNPAAMATCRARFEQDADLTWYTTSVAADDVDDVRQALGYDEINVYGASYGTRLALEYLRRHPDHCRTVTLLGVAPPSASLVTIMPTDVDQKLEILLRECEADASCRAAFPALRAEIESLLADARAGLNVTLTNPATRERETVNFRYDRVASAIRYALYGVANAAQLPLIVDQAAHGNYEPLGNMAASSAAALDEVLYEGYWASVMCSEDLAFVDFEAATRTARNTLLGRSRLEPEIQICMNWPKARVPESFLAPVTSDVPTLLLVGDRDPASPARLAREAAQHLSNGLFVELRNRSHLLLPHDTCDLAIFADFVDRAGAAGTDTSCAARLELPPFTTRLEDLDPTFLGSNIEVEAAPQDPP